MADTVKLGRGQILLGSETNGYLVDAYDVELVPHRADYELFESYEGLISIKKMLDQHTELTFKILLTNRIAPNYNPDDPEANRDDFVKLRETYLDDIDGQSIAVFSKMFKPFQGVITKKEYSVSQGETASEFKIEVKEAGGSVG